MQDQGWDPSVKSLAAFPSVLDMMGRQPQWVASVGDAFLAQPDDVMNSAQRLRAQAKQAGTLKSTPQQTVSTQPGPNNTTVISIAPANPQVVYVPTYNPTVVYGTWPYPAYPPAYYPPPPGSVFATALVSGIGFGLGVAAVDALWGGMNWGHYDVDINVNRYNNINPGHRMPPPPPNANGRANWQHNPANRGNVPYHNPDVAQRFDAARQAGRPAMQGRDAERERAAQAFQNRTGQSIPGHAVPGQRPGQGGAGPQHIGQGGQARAHDGGFSPRAGQPQLSPDQRQRLDQRNAQHHAEAMNRSSAFRGAGNGEAMRGQLERGGAAQSSFHTQRGGAHFGRGRR
ncbi:PF11737 family protein [Bordetella hinzii OH87 BAL007II]|uniref:PF11737 family protein n=1 Tax=Bordetella hinzii OH87 BAL007II TaxID=1331262 RepID=A0ABR4R041_9BORD|nr:PF11737 family protein [Bordetella hinzii OH87 BAL007II]